MTAISPIRIHKPDSCHGWGIDFNYERPFWDADATSFVVAVRQAMQDKKGSAIWFHQSGSDSEIHGRYYGYQYFEVWDACAEKEARVWQL